MYYIQTQTHTHTHARAHTHTKYWESWCWFKQSCLF